MLSLSLSLGPLLALIQKKERFTEREASMVTGEVTNAIEFLHSKGKCVHCTVSTIPSPATYISTGSVPVTVHLSVLPVHLIPGIAHRDLKPENILCEKEDEVRVGYN